MRYLHPNIRRLFLCCYFSISGLYGQDAAVQGRLADEITRQALAGVKVELEGFSQAEFSDAEGNFIFRHPIPLGEQVLVFSGNGYITKRFPVVIEEGLVKELGLLFLEPDLLQDQQAGVISLTDTELDEEEGGFDNISGLLMATKDVFLNAAAFDFGQTFFRPRGLNSEDGKLLINGIEMNKLYNGRPLWSNWGGLNDVQRNQIFAPGLAPSAESFGNLAGTTNIVMRASEYSHGGKASYAVSNRSYTGRAMASYSSGLTPSGWAYSLSLSRRFAEEGYRDGSIYEANSFFVAVERKFNDSHSLNFSGIYTPIRRGKTSANTQEVVDLRGITYNSYWGYQDGEIRNSRMQRVQEPILMLNHYWNLSEETTVNTNLAYQFGNIGNSRIDYGGSRRIEGPEGQESFAGGGSNPDPAYYQKLPSYFLRFEDDLNYRAAYLAQQEILEDGQIDWPSLYAANQTSTATAGNSLYILYEDRNEDRQLTANSILRSQLTDHFTLNASLAARKLESRNFAKLLDLLGGEAFLDVDSFSEGEAAQNNLLNPNRLVGEGDHFKYFYDLDALVLEGFLQTQYTSRNLDLFISGNFSQTSYQRTGFYKNGNFPDTSLGKSEALNFTDYGAKAGLTYKFSGRHLFGLNVGYFTRPPSLRNSFSNSRQNNDVVIGLQSEKVQTADLSYHLRLPYVKARITGYYTEILDATEISFYYADGISGLGRNSTTAFVQEVLSGINKRYMGGEFGMEAQVTQDIKLKAAVAFGEYIYSNNPQLYLTSDDFEKVMDYGESLLKNYRLAGGPQRAYQLGFEYRDPEYWFFSVTTNYFSHAFLDIAPLTRTGNFATDADGLPFNDYNEEIARKLLKQEQFEDYFLVNVIGGKSWRVKDSFIGIFASINNILDKTYKTGGYEQARNANYRSLKEDQEREQPIFGPKYWYGMGTTFYGHVYVRF